jgi:WD40 repeat protein
LKHELVVARPPSLGYRLQKSFRRNRVLFTAAGLVGLTLVLGALVSIWQAVRATRAGRHEAEAHVRADQAARLAETQRERADKEAQKAKASALEARQQAYATDMNLAQHALAVNNIGRAGELLNRHRPQVGESDLRGWEWRYLWQQCRSDALLTVCQQSNSILSLALSPDGKWLAVGEASSGGLSVWDLVTRGEVARLTGGDSQVRVAFSPREPLLAFSTVKLRSPDPQGTICLWNGTIKKIVAEFDLGGECMGLAFTDNGQTLVSYAGNPVNQIALWHVPAGTKLLSYSVPPWDSVSATAGTSFALASQGNVAAVAPDNTIHLIDLATGKERWAKKATEEWVTALALSPDGQILASGAGFTDSAIRLWDVASGKEITRLQGHRAWVSALVFWPDGKTLASASADQSIQLWDLTDLANVPPPRALRGHRQEVWQLALLPDGRTLASGCKDGSVYLWDTTSIQHERTRAILPITVAAWQLGLESASVLTVDLQGHITLWKGTDFRERESLMDLAAQPSPCGWPLRYSVLISRDARFVAAGSTNGLIKVWDLPQRRLLRQFSVGTGVVAPLEFLAQGRSLVTCHWNDDIVREWDIASGQQVRAWPQTVENFFVGFSPDGRWSLLLDDKGASLLREMTTQHDTTQTLDFKGVQDVVFSSDGQRFAAASHLGYAKLWDRATLRELAVLRGFLMGIHSLAFSPDAKRVAATSDGKEAVKLWDVQSCQELLTLEGQGSVFWPIAFSADGNVIGSCNKQGALHLWRAPSWAEIERAETNDNVAIKRP